MARDDQGPSNAVSGMIDLLDLQLVGVQENGCGRQGRRASAGTPRRRRIR